MEKPTRRNWFGLAQSAAALAAPGRGEKIARCEAFGLRIPFDRRVRENMQENYRRENMDRPDYKPWIVVIHTDAGLAGLGESTEDPRPRLAGITDR